MAKILQPTSIKFSLEQRKFLTARARKEKHRKISRAVKNMVDREMFAEYQAQRKGAA